MDVSNLENDAITFYIGTTLEVDANGIPIPSKPNNVVKCVWWDPITNTYKTDGVYLVTEPNKDTNMSSVKC